MKANTGKALLYPFSGLLLLSGCAYAPPESISFEFRSRAETQSEAGVRVTAVVLSDQESDQAFAAPLARQDIQPIWLEIENQEDEALLLMLLDMDDEYFGPSEAAWRSRRFGERGAHEKMRYFHEQHIPVIIPPGSTVSGFVYTNLDPGAKMFAVHLIGERDSYIFHFAQGVPGFQADFLKTRPEDIYAPDEIRDLDLDGLRAYLEALPPCVLGGDRKTPGDPLNLVVVGEGRQVLATFVRRAWDLTETITAGTAWRTATSAATGSRYRTAPVSSLYVFDRPQDVALQKVRGTVHERNHLRLWRAPVNLEGTPVWVGQVSRDIDVKLSIKTVVTHRIDPAVDEARFYVLLDFMASGYLAQVGFSAGVGPAPMESPRYNYTLDPYVTDGLRVVLILSGAPVAYNEIDWLEWERPPSRTAPGEKRCQDDFSARSLASPPGMIPDPQKARAQPGLSRPVTNTPPRRHSPEGTAEGPACSSLEREKARLHKSCLGTRHEESPEGSSPAMAYHDLRSDLTTEPGGMRTAWSQRCMSIVQLASTCPTLRNPSDS